jgi:sulfur-carrier protein
LPNFDVAQAAGEPTTGADSATARPVLRLFAAAREAAGAGRVVLPGHNVGAVLDAACEAYGPDFEAVLVASRVWLNGEPAGRDVTVTDRDEIAVLPPVSGGA